MMIIDNTDYNVTDQLTANGLNNAIQALIYGLTYVAYEAVNTARDRQKSGTFKSQTGNLVSSMGAVIVVEGKIVWASNFEVSDKGKDGATKGLRYAKQIAKDYKEGIALILVAGMNYAVHVSNKGFDVLDTAILQAKRDIAELFQ